MSKRKPVLPNVAAMIEECSVLGLGYFPSKCRSELRAAEAVIQAARRAYVLHPDCIGTGRGASRCAGCRLVRALARLARVTGRKA